MNPVKTNGNFIVYGSDDERRAAFALENDRWLFEAAPSLLQALKKLCNAIVQHGRVDLYNSTLYDDARAAINKAEKGDDR